MYWARKPGESFAAGCAARYNLGTPGLKYTEGLLSPSGKRGRAATMADASAESSAQPSAGPAARMVNTSFSIPVAGAYLQASAEVPAGRTTLTELLPIIQNIENAIVGRIGEELAARNMPISCKAGCGACCRQLVPLNIFEAEALTDWIRALPAERQKTLAERFHLALSALRDAGVIDKILANEHVAEMGPNEQLAIDYFHAGVACPFLENESCSIHPIRPLVCREYLVVSPPELCQDPSINEVTGVPLPLKLSRALHSFGRQIAGDPRGWIPLVFLLAWGRGGQKPGDCVAGTGTEVLNAFLERVAEVGVVRDE